MQGPIQDALAQRLQRVDAVVAQLAQAREQGVNPSESQTIADIERQSLLFVGYLADLKAGRVPVNGVEVELVLHQVDEFCQAIEDGLKEIRQ